MALLLLALFSPVPAAVVGPPCVQLLNAAGVRLPWVSNGAYDLHHISPTETQAMLQWLELGGRGLDTAYSYGAKDQKGVGAAVHQTKVPRAEVFVTTKIPCAGNASAALDYVRQDLSQLQLPYADLVLIHEPSGCKGAAELQGTWKGLEQAVALKLARAIGVSNFKVSQLQSVLASSTIKPAVNQCCMRVGVVDTPTIDFCKGHDIVYQAYSPLGHGTNTTAPPVLLLPEVKAIARAHNVSAAQVAFRFLTQQGHPLVTASGSKAYDTEDLDSLGFNLSKSELTTLRAVKATSCWS